MHLHLTGAGRECPAGVGVALEGVVHRGGRLGLAAPAAVGTPVSTACGFVGGLYVGVCRRPQCCGGCSGIRRSGPYRALGRHWFVGTAGKDKRRTCEQRQISAPRRMRAVPFDMDRCGNHPSPPSQIPDPYSGLRARGGSEDARKIRAGKIFNRCPPSDPNVCRIAATPS